MCICVCLISSMYIYYSKCVPPSLCVFLCVCTRVCVHAAFSADKEGRRVGGKLASLISPLIDCEKFEDDILRKRGGPGAAWLIWLKRSANECQPVT